MSSDDGEDANDIASERETQFVPRSDDDEVLWEVQEITAERGRKYKVKWAGIDPATGKSWPQSWVAMHDCTDKLVAEWKVKKKLKSKKAARGGRTSTTSRASSSVQRTGSSTSGKKTRSSSRRSLAEQEVSPAKTSKTATGKRKRDSMPVALPTSPRMAVQSDDTRPLKKPKVLEALLAPLSSDEDEALFVTPKEQTKGKSPVKHGVLESDVEEGSPRKDSKGKSVQHSEARTVSHEGSRASRPRMRTEVVIPFRDRVDKDVHAPEHEKLGPSKSKQKSTTEYRSPSIADKLLSDVEPLHLPIKVGPPRGAKRREKSRDSDPSNKPGFLRAKSREDKSSDERVHAEKPKGLPRLEAPRTGSGGLLSIQRDITRNRTPTPPPQRISVSAVSPAVRPRTPELSPGARARLEIFDRMMTETSKLDAAAPVHVSEQVPEVMQFNFDDDDGPMNDPLDIFNPPHPPSPLPSTSNPKQVKPITPNGLVVPESETSGNSQSQQELPKPPAPPPHGGLPAIAVITASASPSSTPPPKNRLVQKAFSFASRPPKGRVLKPVPQISPNTFRSSIVRSQRPGSAPPSSIESFGTPKHANKGKQRAIEEEVDQLDTSLPEVEEDDRRKGMAQSKATDAELKRKGKELFEEALRKREVERQKKAKAKRLKTVSDIVNGTTSSPAKAMALPPIDETEDTLPLQWTNVVDSSGGANSATLDTPEHSETKPLSEEEKARLRITLRQEEEESTQEAMGIYPSPPQESRVVDVGDVPKDCGQVEDSEQVEQPSADLQLISVIVEASQEQRQEDTDTEPLLPNRPNSSPPRPIPENLTDSPKRRLGGALSLLNVKSEEIERLERELADERKNAQDLNSELAETRQSLELKNATIVAFDAERAGWSQERSKLKNDVLELEKQREELQSEKMNLFGRVDELSLANRQSLETTKAAQATFDSERAEWSRERSKWEKDAITLEQEHGDLHQQKVNLLSRINELEQAAVRADEMSTRLLELKAERVAWTQERDDLLNKLAQQPEPVVDNKVSEEYEQDRARWQSERASWAEKTAKWETERAAFQEKEQTLSRSAEELTARIVSVTSAKESADKDKEFFRDQYAQASAFVGSVRDENVELEKRVKIAEGQAQEGVAAIKAMFEGRIKALQADIDHWKGLTELLQEKDWRTNDEIRRRAAQTPDLIDLCDRLKTENKSLEDDLRKLGQAHQRTAHQRRKLYYEIYTLKKERMTLRSKLSQLVKATESSTQETSRSAPAPPIPQDPEDMDPNDIVTLPDPPTESSFESNEDLAWYPCMWRPQWRDQCPHVFDTKEDLERHLQQHYHDLSMAQ